MYYDGTKLLSLKDINGKKPEIYICTTNRTAGKTTFFTRLFINRWFKAQEKFVILYRFNYELDDCANKFFGGVKNLFFQGHEMKSKIKHNGVYAELYLDGESCGYAVSLNNADMIRKLSHQLDDAERVLFDEFQSETNHYCADEIKKFLSIHTSLARGNGKQTRYLPVYMLANNVSLLNPYYSELGISSRLQHDTNFLRGDGFVLEQGFNASARDAMVESGFFRAFSANRYAKFAAESVYLNDHTTFVQKMGGRSNYLLTVKVDGNNYSVKEFVDEGVLYCDDSVDSSFSRKVVLNANDHDIHYMMIDRNSLLIKSMRQYFECGAFRFKNLECKAVILKLLAY